jgi:hypothetical protein
MDSLLGNLKPLVGALLMPLPVCLGLTLLGLLAWRWAHPG